MVRSVSEKPVFTARGTPSAPAGGVINAWLFLVRV